MRPAGERFNLAILRALGMRKRGLVFISVIEQLVVLGVGVIGGIGIGLVMARIAVGTASQTDSNRNLLPPIMFSTDWIYIGVLAGALLAVGLVVSTLDMISIRHLNISAILRTSGSKR